MMMRLLGYVKPPLRKLYSVCLVLICLLTTTAACASPPGDQPQPYFSVIPNFQQVHGHHWPLNATLTLEIDAPDTETNPDLISSAVVVAAPWDPGTETWVEFDLSAASDTPLDLVKPGNEFTLSGEGYVKSLVVQPLFVTAVDPANRAIRGTAQPDTQVRVDPNPHQPDTFVTVTVEKDGTWQASNPVWDLQPGFGGDAIQPDPDGDTTQIQIRLPSLAASPTNHSVSLTDFSHHAEVTVFLERLGLSQIVQTDDNGWALITPGDWPSNSSIQLQEGDVLTVTDQFSGLTKTLTLGTISLESVDAENNLVAGFAPPNHIVHIIIENDQGGITTEVISGEDGKWQVNLSALLDLTETMEISASLPDEDFDFTFVGYRPGGQ